MISVIDEMLQQTVAMSSSVLLQSEATFERKTVGDQADSERGVKACNHTSLSGLPRLHQRKVSSLVHFAKCPEACVVNVLTINGAKAVSYSVIVALVERLFF